MQRDPSLQLGSPKKDHPLPSYLPVDEMFRLVDAPPPDSAAGLRARAMLEVLYSCGLRVSELVSLDWDDVDDNLEVIRVQGRAIPNGSCRSDVVRSTA